MTEKSIESAKDIFESDSVSDNTMDQGNTPNPTQGRAISLRRTGVELYGAASGGYDGCCPPVVDPYTLLALITGIALATYFLNLLISVTMVSISKIEVISL